MINIIIARDAYLVIRSSNMYLVIRRCCVRPEVYILVNSGQYMLSIALLTNHRFLNTEEFFVASHCQYEDLLHKNDTLFFEAIFSDNRDMKDTRNSRKIGLINAL